MADSERVKMWRNMARVVEVNTDQKLVKLQKTNADWEFVVSRLVALHLHHHADCKQEECLAQVKVVQRLIEDNRNNA